MTEPDWDTLTEQEIDAAGPGAGVPGNWANPAPAVTASPEPRPAAAPRQQAAGRVPPSGAAQIAAAMSEAQLEEHVRALCKDLGITRFHVRYSRGTTAGLPDDILIGENGVLWRECKTQRGKLTAAQWKAGNALMLAGQDWNTWRPADLLDGTIARELAALAGLKAGAA